MECAIYLIEGRTVLVAFPTAIAARALPLPEDDTSNTIMVVEVSNAKAVPWTKPDDFEYDEKQPKAGLLGLWSGGFNAVMCDGSVRFIQSTIDDETLRRLFNRHDGQAIDRSKF